jgi:hypothetical protein
LLKTKNLGRIGRLFDTEKIVWMDYKLDFVQNFSAIRRKQLGKPDQIY